MLSFKLMRSAPRSVLCSDFIFTFLSSFVSLLPFFVFVGNRYSRVIGGDLSPTMLAETARRFKQEDLGVPELIRCVTWYYA